MGAAASGAAGSACVEVSRCGSITIAADSHLAQRLGGQRAAEGSDEDGEDGERRGVLQGASASRVPWNRRPSAQVSAEEPRRGQGSLRLLGKNVRHFDGSPRPATLVVEDGSPRKRRGSKSSTMSDASTSSGSSASLQGSCASARSSDQLLRATRIGDFKLASEALRTGADVHCRSLRGQTPLMLAASSDQESSASIVKSLLEAGSDIEAKDEKGWTALMHACRNDKMETAQMLLEHGASVTAAAEDGKTALMLAAMGSRKNLGLMKFLVQHDADLDAKDINGWSVLFFACERKHVSMIRWLLLKHDADLEDSAPGGLTPLAMLKEQGFGAAQGSTRAMRRSRFKRPDVEAVLEELGVLTGDHDSARSASPRSASPAGSPRGSARGSSPRSPRGSSPRRSPRSPRGSARAASARTGSARGSSPRASPRSSSPCSPRSARSPRSSPGASPRSPRQVSPRSRRSRRRKSQDLVGVPAAKLLHPEDIDTCKAMVHMFVSARGEQVRETYITEAENPYSADIHTEKELLNYISFRGPNIA
eukprot:gb/GFBE01028412.1/.p1 GENE.gb/GFBE01028412.1/~~gb/GFBE01028412.1/.p1  ORF type:complete len:536 (+),score=83.77 gb/GFBE01028412.1/:1-1608(+)